MLVAFKPVIGASTSLRLVPLPMLYGPAVSTSLAKVGLVEYSKVTDVLSPEGLMSATRLALVMLVLSLCMFWMTMEGLTAGSSTTVMVMS